MTVIQEGFTGSFFFLRTHILEFREQSHGHPAVLACLIQSMIVQVRVIGEEGRQNALDGERASHSWQVVIPFAERNQEVLDIVLDGEKVIGKIREQFCKLGKAGTFEALVIDKTLTFVGISLQRASAIGRSGLPFDGARNSLWISPPQGSFWIWSEY